MNSINYKSTTNTRQGFPVEIQEIKHFNGRTFYNLRGNNYLDHKKVHSEFVPLMNIPFLYCITITYSAEYYKSNHTEQGRDTVMESIFKPLNALLFKAHPDLPTKNHIVDYVRVNELGASDEEIHSHALIHIHPQSLTKVANSVFGYLKNLNPAKMKGVKEVHVQRISDQAGVVSYLCKFEQGKDRNYKHFVFSPNFKRLVARHHCSRFFIYNGKRVEMDSPDDPFKPYRQSNPPKSKIHEPILTGLESLVTEKGVAPFESVRLHPWKKLSPTSHCSSVLVAACRSTQSQPSHTQIALSFPNVVQQVLLLGYTRRLAGRSP